jgi:hypothetical protein
MTRDEDILNGWMTFCGWIIVYLEQWPMALAKDIVKRNITSTIMIGLCPY